MKDLKNYLILIITLLVVGVLFLLFTKTRIQTLQDNNEALKTQKVLVQSLAQKADALGSLNEANLTENVKRLNFILPSDKSVDGLMFSLDRIAQQASVSVSNLTFSPGDITNTGDENKKTISKIKTNKNPTENSNSFNVNLVVSGKLNSIKIFLENLKTSFMAFSIKKLSLSRSSGSAADEQVSMNLILEVYYKPVSMILGDISKPLATLTNEEEKTLSSLINIAVPETISPAPFNNTQGNPFTR